jgi:hypothetical protein
MDLSDKQVGSDAAAFKEPLVHTLENGFIRYVDDPRPTFHLYGLKGAKPIYLNSKEMIQMARDLPMLKDIAEKARQNMLANPNSPDELLFTKTLYKSATSAIKLSVDTYKGNPYIWAKRFFITEASPTDLFPCSGGTHFGPSDDGESILKFVQTCLFRPIPTFAPKLQSSALKENNN